MRSVLVLTTLLLFSTGPGFAAKTEDILSVSSGCGGGVTGGGDGYSIYNDGTITQWSRPSPLSSLDEKTIRVDKSGAERIIREIKSSSFFELQRNNCCNWTCSMTVNTAGKSHTMSWCSTDVPSAIWSLKTQFDDIVQGKTPTPPALPKFNLVTSSIRIFPIDKTKRKPADKASKRTELPSWLYGRIMPFGPMYRCIYKDKIVYYTPPKCCDVPSILRDEKGAVICKPDGGLTGGGDGKCMDFFTERKDCVTLK